jgi:hypothetical protein
MNSQLNNKLKKYFYKTQINYTIKDRKKKKVSTAIEYKYLYDYGYIYYESLYYINDYGYIYGVS